MDDEGSESEYYYSDEEDIIVQNEDNGDKEELDHVEPKRRKCESESTIAELEVRKREADAQLAALLAKVKEEQKGYAAIRDKAAKEERNREREEQYAAMSTEEAHNAAIAESLEEYNRREECSRRELSEMNLAVSGMSEAEIEAQSVLLQQYKKTVDHAECDK